MMNTTINLEQNVLEGFFPCRPSNISVGSYVFPSESRVNSCHLRFSCSEFYADSKKRCHFLGHFKVIFLPLTLEVMTPRSHLFYFNLFYHMSC